MYNNKQNLALLFLSVFLFSSYIQTISHNLRQERTNLILDQIKYTPAPKSKVCYFYHLQLKPYMYILYNIMRSLFPTLLMLICFFASGNPSTKRGLPYALFSAYVLSVFVYLCYSCKQVTSIYHILVHIYILIFSPIFSDN